MRVFSVMENSGNFGLFREWFGEIMLEIKNIFYITSIKIVVSGYIFLNKNAFQ